MKEKSQGRDVIKSIQFLSAAFLTSQLLFFGPGINYAYEKDKKVEVNETQEKLKNLSQREKELLKQLEALKQEKSKLKELSKEKVSKRKKLSTETSNSKKSIKRKFISKKYSKYKRLKRKGLNFEYKNQHYDWDLKPNKLTKYKPMQYKNTKAAQTGEKKYTRLYVEIEPKESLYCKIRRKGPNRNQAWIYKTADIESKKRKPKKKDPCKIDVELVPLDSFAKPKSDFSWIFKQYPEDRGTTAEDILKGHASANLDKFT